ncbi:MAG: hypothetical protein ABIJ61_04450 [bacterium]
MWFSHRILVGALVAIMVLATAPLLAGEKIDTKGTWALQFGLESDVRLTGFQGTTLSLQKTTMSGAIWRMGLGVSLSNQDRETEQITEDTSYIASTENSNSSSISLTIQRMFKLNSSTKIHPYVGIGPLVKFNHSSSDQGAPNNPTHERTYNSWSVGARTLFGAEWFVTGYLSLLGEYSLDAAFEWSKDSRTTIYEVSNGTTSSTNETRIDGFRVSKGYTYLAVSLYF